MDPENSENQPVGEELASEPQDRLETAEESKVEAESVQEKVQPEPEKKPQPQPATAKTQKIEIRLQAAGDAPIMKQKNYKVDGEKQISWILAFIRKYLKLEPQDNLFVYVNQAFSPSPDQTVTNLAECFGQDNKLVLYYSRSQAWG